MERIRGDGEERERRWERDGRKAIKRDGRRT